MKTTLKEQLNKRSLQKQRLTLLKYKSERIILAFDTLISACESQKLKQNTKKCQKLPC